MVVGFGLAGLLHVLLPVGQVTRHFGRPGIGGVLKAALIGMPLPLCSCSVIPVASAIRKQGASRGATGSFLISVPETGVDSFTISYALLGPVLAIARPLAALITALVAGTAIDRLVPHPTPADPPRTDDDIAASDCCTDNASDRQAACPEHQDHDSPQANTCCRESQTSPSMPLSLKLRQAGRYGFITMFEDLGGWLIASLVPDGFLDRRLGSGLGVMLLMLAASLPMYVCASASTPVAATLIAKGLSPGAALVFLLAGAATNVATIVIVARQLGRRSLAIYLTSIGLTAILLGLATDRVLNTWPVLGRTVETQVLHAKPSLIAWPFALILTALILNGLRLSRAGTKSP
jgi:hypothetical protein